MNINPNIIMYPMHYPRAINKNSLGFHSTATKDAENDYVMVPKEKYEKNKMWSKILIGILAIDLTFTLYRFFKKG